jgi:hypothetical protein
MRREGERTRKTNQIAHSPWTTYRGPFSADAAEHPTVEARVFRDDSLPEAIGFQHHSATLAHAMARISRESDVTIREGCGLLVSRSG